LSKTTQNALSTQGITHSQVFKVQNVPQFSGNIPFTHKSGVKQCDPIF
jgi:hypothetical protein